MHLEGFIILDHYASRYEAFRQEMTAWVDAGQVRLREDRVEGLESAPATLIGLLQGRNHGKVVVSVADL